MPMISLKQQFCNQHKLSINETLFITSNFETINDDDTPKSLGLNNMSTVYVSYY